MSIKEKEITHVFFSQANHDKWGGKGTVEVTDGKGVAHKANYFGGSATPDLRGLIPSSGDNIYPPNPYSYVYLGRIKNSVLKLCPV